MTIEEAAPATYKIELVRRTGVTTPARVVQLTIEASVPFRR